MQLFEYVVFFDPGEEPKEGDPAAQIIDGPHTVLEKTHQAVMLKVARKLPEKWVERIDRVTIAIKPF